MKKLIHRLLHCPVCGARLRWQLTSLCWSCVWLQWLLNEPA